MSRYAGLLLLPIAAVGRAATADILDIRGPLAIDMLPPFALSCAVLLVTAAGLLVHRRQGRRSPLPSVAAIRPDVKDLLERLAGDYRQGRCSGDQILVRLDGIVRDHLPTAAPAAARRLTSAELRAAAGEASLGAQLVLLDELLPLFDRIKFAAYRPAPAEVETAIESAARLLIGSRGDRGDALS